MARMTDRARTRGSRTGARARGNRTVGRPAASPEWLPGSPRTLLVAAFVLVVLAAASVPVLNIAVYSPARTVEQYLHAVADADAGRALGLLDAPNAQWRTLTDEALQNAPSLPQDIRIAHTEVDGDTATVTARANLANSTQELTFDLVRLPATWGLWNRWVIRADDWPHLDIAVDGSGTAEVNGVTVPVTDGPVPVLFPASYNVGFSGDYFRADAVHVDVTGPAQTHEVTLEPEPTDALRDAVDEAVRAHLDGCAEQKVLMPTGCTFGYETENEILEDPTWTVEEYPAVTLEESGSDLRMKPAEAALTVRTRERDIVTAHAFDIEEEIRFSMTATVLVDGTAVRIVPSQAGKTLAG